ncbi:MAG: efflux RND transporter periplasmic adaptor subunit [Lacisediminimonas sp.]|nr:efflux RND transporter periplasmic adaptor subunit [Lacisediminimonas sp.]
MKPLMPKRRSFWLVAIVVLVAGVLAISLGAMQKKKKAAAPAVASAPQTLEFLPSDIAQAQVQDLRQTLALTGALRAVNQAAVKARIAGEVQAVLVREGETVQAGQILVRMDVREYESRAAQTRGALQAARAQLDIATKARENNRALLEKNFISKNAFDNAQSQFEIARANVESARGALDVTQKALSDTVIRAPIAGIISSRSVQPGEKVSADNKLLEVIDLRTMELEGAVPTSEIMAVSLGQEVQTSFAGLAAPVTGQVVRINPAIQAGSRSILVYVRIDNLQGQLKAGMFGDARLTLVKKQGVLTVPQSAVRTDAGSSTVYAIQNGVIVRKPVRLGLRGSTEAEPSVEVLEGLSAGERVVRVNLGELHPGTVVKVSGAGTAAAAVNGGASAAAAR